VKVSSEHCPGGYRTFRAGKRESTRLRGFSFKFGCGCLLQIMVFGVNMSL